MDFDAVPAERALFVMFVFTKLHSFINLGEFILLYLVPAS